ncbi:MAG: restriction endonuclease subunit S [Veillonella atypica]|uniref:restriction endonuclease subunit S n=1 Tax=Veillonella atypica TaxID=39777 RepID=UPI0039940FCD
MEFIRVEDCCDILDSQRKPITESERVPGMYPYYGANGIQGTINQYIFDGKLVLVAEDGGHFGSKTKPIAYLVNGKCWVNNHAHVLRAKKGFLAEYICYSLMFYKIEGYINGATRQKLTQAALRKLIIPKRPVEYQKAIVDRLDLVKCIIEKKQDLINELDVLIKSRFVEMFGIFNVNTNNQNTIKFKDLIEQNNTNEDDLVWLLNLDMIKANTGEIVEKVYINRQNIPTSSISFKTGTVLYSKLRPYLNKVVIADGNGYGTSELIPLNSDKNGLTAEYLAYYLRQDSFVEYIKDKVTGAKMPRVAMDVLRNIDIVQPNYVYQEQFSSFVYQINKLKADVQKSIDEAQLLMDSLMQEYFG